MKLLEMEQALSEEAMRLREEGATLSTFEDVKRFLQTQGIGLAYTAPNIFGPHQGRLALSDDRRTFTIRLQEDYTYPYRVRPIPPPTTLIERVVLAHEYAHIVLFRRRLDFIRSYHTKEQLKAIEDLCEKFAGSLLGLSIEEIEELDRPYRQKEPVQTRFL